MTAGLSDSCTAHYRRADLSNLRISGGAEIVVAINIIAPPWREGHSSTSRAEDCKGQDEECRETGTIESAGNEIRIVLENARPVVSEIELDEESSNDLAKDDASLGLVIWDVAGVLDELGHVDLVERKALDFRDKLDVVRIKFGHAGEEKHSRVQ